MKQLLTDNVTLVYTTEGCCFDMLNYIRNVKLAILIIICLNAGIPMFSLFTTFLKQLLSLLVLKIMLELLVRIVLLVVLSQQIGN